MPEKYSSLTPNEFANNIVNYAKDRASLGAPSDREQAIPSHWTYAIEGTFPATSCLAFHGLIDRVFDRRPINPQRWYQFERGYRSPAAEIIERMYLDTKGEGLLGLIGSIPTLKDGRNPYFMTGDFWTKKTQSQTLEVVLAQLRMKGWISDPTRIYEDEEDVVGLYIPGIEKFDIPTSYRGLERTATNMIEPNERYVAIGDYPRIEKFGDRVPACYMVASTVEVGDERFGEHADKSPYQKLISLVKENTRPIPEYQHILYVMGEIKKGDKEIFIPRYVGNMTAFMLEYAYGTPVGVRMFDYSYMVPQSDMSPEERQHVDNSMSNWNSNKKNIVKSHPQIFPQ